MSPSGGDTLDKSYFGSRARMANSRTAFPASVSNKVMIKCDLFVEKEQKARIIDAPGNTISAYS